VAVAEHTGQVGRLTEVVLREGLRRVREWAERDRPLSIAVNLSQRSLLDPAFPTRVAELLAVEEDLHIVGRVGDSVAAVRIARETKPDAILLDVEMPYHPVSVTMRALRRAAPQARILILTVHDEPRLLQEVLAAGAHGVLMKTATREELVGAIRAVGYHGKTVLSVSTRSAVEPELVQQMIADRSSVSAICRAASAMASPTVGSGSARCALTTPR